MDDSTQILHSSLLMHFMEEYFEDLLLVEVVGLILA